MKNIEFRKRLDPEGYIHGSMTVDFPIGDEGEKGSVVSTFGVKTFSRET